MRNQRILAKNDHKTEHDYVITLKIVNYNLRKGKSETEEGDAANKLHQEELK